MSTTPTTQVTRGVAIVTGGSSGIGLATATALAAEGFTVVVTGRHRQRLDDATARLRDKGHDAYGYVCDVRSPEGVREFVDSVVRAHGEPSVLVNNAGRSGGGPTARLTDELWRDVVDTNLNGVFWTTREVLRRSHAIRQPGGRIVNIASTGGKQGVPLGAPYSASKAGVIGFSKALAKEYAASGPTVNAVCPGYVETAMADEVIHGVAAATGTDEREVRASFEAKIPLGRYSTPEEVAGMVRYLVSSAADSVTAQAINVCGGLGAY